MKSMPRIRLKTVCLSTGRTNRREKRKLSVFKMFQHLIPKKKSRVRWRIGLLWLQQAIHQKWREKKLQKGLNCKINGDWIEFLIAIIFYCSFASGTINLSIICTFTIS